MPASTISQVTLDTVYLASSIAWITALLPILLVMEKRGLERLESAEG